MFETKPAENFSNEIEFNSTENTTANTTESEEYTSNDSGDDTANDFKSVVDQSNADRYKDFWVPQKPQASWLS